MEYKILNCNSYNIHTIKTNKFKTIRMEIIFSGNVSKEKMPIYSFLADLLCTSSKEYKSKKEIAIKLEELYLSNFYDMVNKTGNLFTVSFVMEFINPRYIKDKNYLKEAISFPFEILNNPNVSAKEFDITCFNIVKKKMKEEIESIKESSDKLAIINGLKTMDSNSPSSYRVLGSIEDLEKITSSKLYDAYEELFDHFNCDIFVIGNINMDSIVKLIKNNYKNNVIKIDKPNLLVNNKIVQKIKIKEVDSVFVQSTLVMIYNIKGLSRNEKNISFHVFNYIFGSGGISSKLYKNLRTDASLCYSVRSLYLKYDELLIIQVSLDESNVDKAKNLINKSVKEMLDGDYSENDIEDAVKNLKFSINIGLDNNTSILNNYYFNYLDELPLPEERLELFSKVSKKDLIKCANSLSLNTIYIQRAQIQKAGDNNARD